MTDKQIIIDGINVSELTGEQLVCMNRYEVARLFAKLVDVLSEIEDDYNNAQEDRVRMWTDNTGLTDKLKRKEQECEELKKELEVIYDDCKGCPTCNEALYNASLYARDYRKLKQTLIEIKDYCNGHPQNSIGFKKYIMQKISEVLDDRTKQS